MNLYPVYLSLRGVRCLVVGGGSVALRKVASLVACGAAVTVVSPDLCAGLTNLSRQGRICCRRQRYGRRHISGQRLVVAATNDPGVNAQVSKDAQQLGALVNVVDAPALCTVFIPSVIRVNPLVVTVATQGRFPGLAKKMRLELTPLMRGYAKQVRVLARLRDAVKNSSLTAGQRQRLIRALLSSRVMSRVESGRIRTMQDLTGYAGMPRSGRSNHKAGTQ